MIRIGLVGVGFMGWIHWLAYQRVPGVQVAAICTRNEKRRAGDWRGIQGNFGPPGEQVDLSQVAKYAELDELLSDPAVDLVDVCLPPHLHLDASCRALRAGKHVLCEKPLALTTQDCDTMVRSAAESGKQLLVGHVLPFFPEYAHARQVIASGQYGRLLGGHFKRVISDPLWLPDFYDPNRVGGPLVDLHVHDAHLIRSLFGTPQQVTSVGRMRGEVVEFCHTLFHFNDPSLAVSASCGVVNQQGRSFTHGFEIHLEQATLNYEAAFFSDGAESLPLKILTSEGRVIRPDLGAGDPIQAFEAEIREVATSIETGRGSELLGGALARDAILLCHRQTESVVQRATVRV